MIYYIYAECHMSGIFVIIFRLMIIKQTAIELYIRTEIKNMIIKANDERIISMGRKNVTPEGSVKFYHAGTQLHFRFKGTYLKINLLYENCWGELSLGLLTDGIQNSIPLLINQELRSECIVLAENLESGKTHDIILYKKHGGNQFLEIAEAETDGEFIKAAPLPELKIEVYGDSVCAGEVIDADGFEGKNDPEDHNCRYTDVWNSFVMQTARSLGTQIHNISQGGLALLNGTGYFNEPQDYPGLETVYDRTNYTDMFGELDEWDFNNYKADIVIIAIGQNDRHDGINENDNINIVEPSYREKWKSAYKKICRRLNEAYGGPCFILTTTILFHDVAWDEAIGEIKDELVSEGIKAHHNIFIRNGKGTPGHPRLSEHNEMAGELTGFIKQIL